MTVEQEQELERQIRELAPAAKTDPRVAQKQSELVTRLGEIRTYRIESETPGGERYAQIKRSEREPGVRNPKEALQRPFTPEESINQFIFTEGYHPLTGERFDERKGKTDFKGYVGDYKPTTGKEVERQTAEAKAQAEIHGITREGKFQRSLTEEEYESLSPALREEYNIQAKASQSQAENTLVLESRLPKEIGTWEITFDKDARPSVKNGKADFVKRGDARVLSSLVKPEETSGTLFEKSIVTPKEKPDVSFQFGKGALGLEKAKAQIEREEFKNYIKEYQRLGVTFDIIKDGKLIAVTSKEHPYFDILKATKGQENVSITPTKRLLITGERQPSYKMGSAEKSGLAALTPFYNLAVFAYFAPKSIAEYIETAPKQAKSPIDYLTKGYAPKTAREQSIYELPDPTIDYLTTGRTPPGYTQQERDIYLASNTALFLLGARGKGTTTTKVKVATQKPIEIVQPTPLTKVYKPTNPYRTPLRKDIFDLDIAEPTPRISEKISTPRNTLLEDVSKETQKKLKDTQTRLLEPVTKKETKPLEPIPPEETNILGRRGKPPIQRTLPSEPIMSRAQVVEETRIKPEHEVFSSKGKLLGKFGDISKPLGALSKESKTKGLSKDLDYSPTKIRRNEVDELLGIRQPTKTRKIESSFRDFIESTYPKSKTVQEVKGYKPDIKEFYTRPGKIDTDRLLDIEKPQVGEPKEFTQAAKKFKPLDYKPTKKQLTPSDKDFRNFMRRFETKYEEPRKPAGQITIQLKKEEVKAITKQEPKQATTKLKKRSAVAALVGTQYQEEETYLYKGRPRLATRTISITQPRIQEKESLDLITSPTLGIKPAIKIDTVRITKQRPETITLITPKAETKQGQRPRLVPRQTTKTPTPLMPKPKVMQTQPQAQRQPQRQLTRGIPRVPKKLKVILALPFQSKPRGTKPRKEKPGARADFIGNVSLTRIEGIYKRQETTYGQKRISKLITKDIGSKQSKGFFKSKKTPNIISKSKPNLISRPKNRRIKL